MCAKVAEPLSFKQGGEPVPTDPQMFYAQSYPAVNFILNLARKCENEVNIISPFVTTSGMKKLLQALPDTPLKLRLCSKFVPYNFAQKSSNIEAYHILNEWNPAWDIRYFNIPNLHAKIFKFDNRCVVTSANLTHGGFFLNYEFGIVVEDVHSVKGLIDDIQTIFSVASPISFESVIEIASAVSAKRFVQIIETEELATPSPTQAVEPEDGNDSAPNEPLCNELELERLKRFSALLGKHSTDFVNKYPFLELGYLEAVKTAEGSGNPDLFEIVNRDLDFVKQVIQQLTVKYSIGTDAETDLFHLFVKSSFINSMKQQLLDPTWIPRTLYYKNIGLNVIRLHVVTTLFSGNYTFVERIGFFAKAIASSGNIIDPVEMLDKLDAHWCVFYGDLAKNWELDQLQILLGIIFYHNRDSAMNILKRCADVEELFSLSVYEARDYKTSLQEASQNVFGQDPQYSVVSLSGPDHSPSYTVEVRVKNLVSKAIGSSKKDGEVSAAKALLMKMVEQNHLKHDDLAIKREVIKDLESYSLRGPFKERLEEYCSIFGFGQYSRLADCAITASGERNMNRCRRSNEKLALLGSILRSLMVDVHCLKQDLFDFRHNVSNKDFVGNFNQFLDQWGPFQHKYLHKCNDGELASICESTYAAIWLRYGWKGLDQYPNLVKPRPARQELDPVSSLQELLVRRGYRAPEYIYASTGTGHHQRYGCEVLVDGEKALHTAIEYPSKKDARREGSMLVLAKIDGGAFPDKIEHAYGTSMKKND